MRSVIGVFLSYEPPFQKTSILSTAQQVGLHLLSPGEGEDGITDGITIDVRSSIRVPLVFGSENDERVNDILNVHPYSKVVPAPRRITEFVQEIKAHGLYPTTASVITQQAVDYIYSNIRNPNLCVEEIAKRVNASSKTLTRYFRRDFGRATWEHVQHIRVQLAMELLHDAQRTIGQVLFDVGVSDASRFSHLFHNRVGCSPTKYRERLRLQHGLYSRPKPVERKDL